MYSSYVPVMQINVFSLQPTVERFIQMNRGINCGADLPSDFLVVS